MYKILLADDERIILDGMAGIIEWESLGASLIGKAQNGHEAYEKIVHKQPHIVITDVKMPGMDGLEPDQKGVSHQSVGAIYRPVRVWRV